MNHNNTSTICSYCRIYIKHAYYEAIDNNNQDFLNVNYIPLIHAFKCEKKLGKWSQKRK